VLVIAGGVLVLAAMLYGSTLNGGIPYFPNLVIPITVQRYFTPAERIDPLYVRARSPEQVDRVAQRVQQIIEARHRPGARYKVETLTALVKAARNISLILSIVLFLVAGIALGISGVGIMNIMLVAVNERTREIGLRKAVGANNANIIWQFLIETIIITTLGGIIGIIVGVAVSLLAALVIRKLGYDWSFAVSISSIIMALIVSAAIGLIFGIYPASKASRLQPVEALRYE